MKKLFILSGLLLFPILVYSQGDFETKKLDQSLTITLAPTIFGVLDEEIDPTLFWPTSLYVTKNFPLKMRFSFSTGIHFLYKKIIDNGFIIPDFGSYYGPIKTTNKYYLIDIPFRLNYHIVKPNNKFNLYAKTELKNSFIANHGIGEPNFQGDYVSYTEYGYNLFFGFGFGLDFKIIERLNAVLEPGLNYSVIGFLPDVGLIDCQLGIKYTLIKNK